MRSHLHFSMGAELIFSTICGDKNGVRTEDEAEGALCSVSCSNSAVKCNAMQCYVQLLSMEVCVHLLRASQSRVTFCLCVTGGQRRNDEKK